MFLHKINHQIKASEHSYQNHINNLNHLLLQYDKLQLKELRRNREDEEIRRQKQQQQQQQQGTHEVAISSSAGAKNPMALHSVDKKRAFHQTTTHQEEGSTNGGKSVEHSSAEASSRKSGAAASSRTKPRSNVSGSNAASQKRSNVGRTAAASSSSSTATHTRSSSRTSRNASRTKPTSTTTTTRKRFISGVGGSTSSSVIGSFGPGSTGRERPTGKRRIPLSKRKTISSQKKESATQNQKASQKLSLDQILKQAKKIKKTLAETENIPEKEENQDSPVAATELQQEDTTSGGISKLPTTTSSVEDATTREGDKHTTSHHASSTQHKSTHDSRSKPSQNHKTEASPPKESHPLIKFQKLHCHYQEMSQLMMRSINSFLKTFHSSLLPSSQHINLEKCQLRKKILLLHSIQDYYQMNRDRITEHDLTDAEAYMDALEDPDSFCEDYESACMDIMFGSKATETKEYCKKQSDSFRQESTFTPKMSDLSIIKWIPDDISGDVSSLLQPPLYLTDEHGKEHQIVVQDPNSRIHRYILSYHSKKELNRLYELRHLIQYAILQEYIEVNVARAYMRHFKKLHPQSKDFLWLYRLLDAVLLRESSQTCSFVPKMRPE